MVKIIVIQLKLKLINITLRRLMFSMKNKIKYIVVLVAFMFISFPVNAATYVTCGPIKELPYKVLELSNTIVNVLQIAVPVILVLFGMIDMIKAVSSQKDDDIKKAQGTLIKRLIMGVLVYFIIFIVKLLLSAIGGNTDGIWSCVQCFVSNASGCS